MNPLQLADGNRKTHLKKKKNPQKRRIEFLECMWASGARTIHFKDTLPQWFSILITNKAVCMPWVVHIQRRTRCYEASIGRKGQEVKRFPFQHIQGSHAGNVLWVAGSAPCRKGTLLPFQQSGRAGEDLWVSVSTWTYMSRCVCV